MGQEGLGAGPEAESPAGAASKDPGQRDKENMADLNDVGWRWCQFSVMDWIWKEKLCQCVFTQKTPSQSERVPGEGSYLGPGQCALQLPVCDTSQLKQGREPGGGPEWGETWLRPLLPALTQAPNELSAWNFNMLKMTVVLPCLPAPDAASTTDSREEDRGTDDVRPWLDAQKNMA